MCAKMRALFQLWREVHGQDLTEYALLVAVLALALVTAYQTLGCTVSCMFEEAAISIQKARGHIPPGQQKKCSRKCT
jgi:Flp pilus assembly pilin Flp